MAFLWHSHHIGNGKSSQLTNSIIFRGVGIPPTSSQETDHLGMISWWGLSFDDYLCESFIKGSLGVYTSVWRSLRAMKSTVIACDCKERALQVTVTAKNSHWRLDARTVSAKRRHCKEQPLQRTVTAGNRGAIAYSRGTSSNFRVERGDPDPCSTEFCEYKGCLVVVSKFTVSVYVKH